MNKEIEISYASQNLEKVNLFDEQMFSLGIHLKRYDTYEAQKYIEGSEFFLIRFNVCPQVLQDG